MGQGAAPYNRLNFMGPYMIGAFEVIVKLTLTFAVRVTTMFLGC